MTFKILIYAQITFGDRVYQFTTPFKIIYKFLIECLHKIKNHKYFQKHVNLIYEWNFVYDKIYFAEN